jgi:hypothetical protein
MSHGVHAVQHEVEHELKHAEHGGHEKPLVDSQNKRIALLISVIALFLAFSETLGKAAQTDAISYNVEASNLWNFFQAKTIRRTLVETAAQEMKVSADLAADAAVKTAMSKQIDTWQKTAQRYRTEPETNEGSVELMARAKVAETKRDTAMARYHHYEVASALYQIGIVLASAAVITSMVALAYVAGLLGLVGIVFTGIGFFAPHAVHLF